MQERASRPQGRRAEGSPLLGNGFASPLETLLVLPLPKPRLSTRQQERD